MAVFNEEAHQTRKEELMRKCYECFAENGLKNIGIRALGKYCGCNSATLYLYFKDLDDLIVQSTEYCMSKVEDDFMEKAPKTVNDIEPFINEIPYWTAKQHGPKYRLMYQVYTDPKYREYGKLFFEGVNRRYIEYAKLLEKNIGIPYEEITSLIFILIRASVHYALFEDEFYLQAQLKVLKGIIPMFLKKYSQ
ncbi:MAG: TetR/AcrR family transcriptional regulator [Erysipelotrichaceae bacterium]|nr:TetR/AcrR family transcriptional regulator [Erysipelotrichaceae bacterium]